MKYESKGGPGRADNTAVSDEVVMADSPVIPRSHIASGTHTHAQTSGSSGKVVESGSQDTMEWESKSKSLTDSSHLHLHSDTKAEPSTDNRHTHVSTTQTPTPAHPHSPSSPPPSQPLTDTSLPSMTTERDGPVAMTTVTPRCHGDGASGR